MLRLVKIFLISLFVATLLTVGLQSFWPLFPAKEKLMGVTETPPEPVWNLATLRNGEAFRATSLWYDARVGFRNFWVRLDNTVTYVFFGEATERRVGTNLVVGPHDWVFERHYIKNAIMPFAPEDERIRQAIQHIRSVQDKLARRGIPLLVVVAPNKAQLYPEHISAAQLGGRDVNQIVSEYEHYKPDFVAAGINLIDGPGLFRKWKQSGTRYLYARSGTHWSYQSALRILNDIRDRLNVTMRRPMPPLTVESELMEPAQLSDVDLLNLLNLRDGELFNHPQPMPRLLAQKTVPVEKLPRIMWVHDSFGWPLIELLYNANAAQPNNSFYYFESVYHIPGGVHQNIEIKDIDWEAYLKKQDAVVVVWTEIAFTYLSWNFFDELDRRLP